jgi:hypothetical protein
MLRARAPRVHHLGYIPRRSALWDTDGLTDDAESHDVAIRTNKAALQCQRGVHSAVREIRNHNKVCLSRVYCERLTCGSVVEQEQKDIRRV